MRPRGSLTAVGIGIRAPAQATPEASSQIEHAQKVFSLVADPIAAWWLLSLNDNVESLGSLYAVGKPRNQTYEEMVQRITGTVKEGLRVCAVAYGHPGIFAYPLHESIHRLRADGYEAKMLAGISAEDCFFADTGIDPAVSGCRSYEATDFLLYGRPLDTATGLFLWQVDAIGETSYRDTQEAWNRDGLRILAERLLQAYRANHEVIVYEAAQLPLCESTVTRVALSDLPQAPMSALSSLYVPAMTKPKVDRAMARRLGLAR